MNLNDRIDAAIKRITSGAGVMRIPADETDPDLVLADCKALNAELVKALELALVGIDQATREGGPSFLGHALTADRMRAVLAKARATP